MMQQVHLRHGPVRDMGRVKDREKADPATPVEDFGNKPALVGFARRVERVVRVRNKDRLAYIMAVPEMKCGHVCGLRIDPRETIMEPTCRSAARRDVTEAMPL